MWVTSKHAAKILSVKYDALMKAAKRAEKAGKKFCSIKPNILCFTYTDGVGRGGKTLQIWIDDNLINDENSEIAQQSAPAPIKNSAESEDKCPEPAPSAPQNERSDARLLAWRGFLRAQAKHRVSRAHPP